MSGRRHAALAGAAATAALVQVGPAATWLPPVRRMLTPRLQGRGGRDGVGLTFDDGPHPDGTPAVLDALARLGMSATFFVLGSAARRHPALVGDIVAAGHEVGVHGDEHRYLIARPPTAAAADLRRARDTVAEITGAAPRWWRPPYGVLSGPALVAAAALGLEPVLWSAWGRDWRAEATPQSVVTDLTGRRLPGATLLLHDSDATSAPGSWQTTVAALPLLAARLSADRLVARSLSTHVAAG